MNPARLFFILLFSFLSFGKVSAQGTKVVARLESSHLVIGEQTKLILELHGLRMGRGWPATPNVSPLTVQQVEQSTILSNRRTVDAYTYRVSSIRAGTFTIPPFEFPTTNGVLKTDPLKLHVFRKDQLNVGGLSLTTEILYPGGRVKRVQETVPYLSGIFFGKENPYLGETQNVEAKLYIPATHKLGNAPFVDVQKKDIAAWRFTVSANSRQNLAMRTGDLKHEGVHYHSFSFPSAFSVLKAGEISLGPGKIAPIIQWVSGRRWVQQEVDITFPERKLQARNLPKPTPTDFGGAVGNFLLAARPLTTEAEQGSNITIALEVSGTGNLDQFKGPVFKDTKNHWKQFDMIRKPQGSERRTTTGVVEFSQVVRPKKVVPTLPSYHFIYFDPLLEKYITLRSPPQALTITPSAIAEAATETSSTLALLTPTDQPLRTFSKGSGLPAWLWQIIPAAILLGFGVKAFSRSLKRREVDSIPTKEFNEALSQVSSTSSNRVTFYRDAANFITRWNGSPDEEDFINIQQVRDEICFSPDIENEPVSAEEKSKTLTALKRLAPVILTALFLSSNQAKAFSDDPAIAKKEILAEIEKSPSPEHFYNLSICEKTLQNEPAAALWAYRYGAQGGETKELLSGLPGIRPSKRKGADWLSFFALAFYQQLLAAGIWSILLIFVVTKLRGRKLRSILLVSLSIFGPLLIVLGTTAWLLYPKDVSFKPLHQMSVVMKTTPLNDQPYDGGNERRTVDGGSIGLITAKSREWLHLEFPGGTKGWLKRDLVEDVVPEE